MQTSRDLYRLAFLVFVLSIGLNLCISFFRFRKKSFETGKEAEFREKAGILLGLLGTILLSCIPLFTDHIYGGSDITYHLLRIGNLKDGFLSGQFPVRIDTCLAVWKWVCFFSMLRGYFSLFSGFFALDRIYFTGKPAMVSGSFEYCNLSAFLL